MSLSLLLAFSALLGGTVGCLSGFFGIGGSSLALPCLLWFYHFTQPGQETTFIAFATALAVTASSSSFSAFFGALEGRLVWPQVRALALPGAIGAFVGALVGLSTKPAFLKILTGLMLIYLGNKILKQFRPKLQTVDAPVHVVPTTRSNWFTGLFSGAVYSLAGTGGAAVITVHLLKQDLNAKQAISTTAAATGVMGVASVLGFGLPGQMLMGRPIIPTLDWYMFGVLAPTLLMGNFIGNRLSRKVNASQLRKYLGYLLSFLGLVVLVPASIALLP